MRVRGSKIINDRSNVKHISMLFVSQPFDFLSGAVVELRNVLSEKVRHKPSCKSTVTG